MNNYKKTQWHPPFVAAVRLELRENKKDLLFEPEKILNSKPIQLDLLVIKKPQNIASGFPVTVAKSPKRFPVSITLPVTRFCFQPS